MEKHFEERNLGRLFRFSRALREGSADDRPGPAYEYLSQREVGGNMATIHFGHAIDFVQNGRFSLSLIFKQPKTNNSNISSGLRLPRST